MLEQIFVVAILCALAWFIWTIIQQRPPSPPSPSAPRASDSKKNQSGAEPMVLKISDLRLLINGVWHGGRNYPKYIPISNIKKTR